MISRAPPDRLDWEMHRGRFDRQDGSPNCGWGSDATSDSVGGYPVNRYVVDEPNRKGFAYETSAGIRMREECFRPVTRTQSGSIDIVHSPAWNVGVVSALDGRRVRVARAATSVRPRERRPIAGMTSIVAGKC